MEKNIFFILFKIYVHTCILFFIKCACVHSYTGARSEGWCNKVLRYMLRQKSYHTAERCLFSSQFLFLTRSLSRFAPSVLSSR